MSESSKSKSIVKSVVKPMNIFYVWYGELCRRANTTPLATIKTAKSKNQTILDFVTDRIKTDEWTPIINAIGLDTSLHVIAIRSKIPLTFSRDINTEEKVRHMKRQTGVIFTDYFFNSLIRSLGCCLINNTVLSTLELEGLPLENDYLALFLENLKRNKTIKKLTLKRCPIGDEGCNQLCNILRSSINIEVLNLSGCNLSSISGQYIAKAIKFQQTNRYTEIWHRSLRYEEPDANSMAGLKRLNLNNNPQMGDEGLFHILNELADDLWIKALDMQKCNITDRMSKRILEVLETNKSLSVADFRNNALSLSTMQKIFSIYSNDSEFEWCATASSLQDSTTVSETNLAESSVKVLQKTKSVPLNKLESPTETELTNHLRKIKTVTTFDRQPKFTTENEINGFKRQLWELNYKLGEEVRKRRETEKKNRELIEKLKSFSYIESLPTQNNTCTKIIKYKPIQKEKTCLIGKETTNHKVYKPKKSNGNLRLNTQKQEVTTENNNPKQTNFEDVRNLFDAYLNAKPKNDNELLVTNETVNETDQVEKNCLTYYYNEEGDNFVEYRDENPSGSLDDSADSSKSLSTETTTNDTNRNHPQQLTNENNFQKLPVEVR